MDKEITPVMSKLGIGNVMTQMKQQITQIKSELKELGEPEDIPEMIQSTNLIRVNEHLSKSNKKKSELLLAYDEYAQQLEKLVTSVFEIQDQLKEIVKDQSALISSSSSKKSNSSKRKTVKKSKK